jgi:hypothetical protein
MAADEERRRQFRLPAEQTVQLTVLGMTDISVIGKVVDVSSRGVGLLVPCTIEPGSKIQVGLGDSALFGEVRYCQAEGQEFALGVQLEKPINSVSDLVRVLR